MGSCSSCCRTGVRFEDEPQLLSTSSSNDNDSGNVEHSVEDSDGLEDSGDETEMEEEVNTQQATQIHVDPRRLGRNNSGIYDKDLADLICILHPTSPLAHRVVEDLARTNPQHIFRNEELLAPIDNDDPEISPSNPQGAPRRPSTTSHDIALRLSSTVKDITMGFVFGRNILRSDILLNVSDDAKRLSNTHFRIYLNESGVVMLQDCSTNGTRVDDIMLRYKPVANEPVNGASRMLITGSCIELMTGTQDNIKFMVRIPKERHPYEDDYAEKVDERSRAISEEVARREEARRKNNAARGLAGQVFPGAAAARAGGILHQNIGGPPNVAPPRPPPHTARSMRRVAAKAWNGGDKYNFIRNIGSGAFATVYEIATKNNGVVYAAKEIQKKQLHGGNPLDYTVDNEMTIMSRLRHPCIIEYHECHEYNHYLYIIMEYLPDGNIGTYLSEYGTMPEPLVKAMAHQLLWALDYLHQQKITHRDLKPDNILIASHDPFRVKLTDFGLSKYVEDTETHLRTFCGTILYCAPEVYPDYAEFVKKPQDGVKRGRGRGHSHSYDESVDMWSLGAVLFQCLSGKPAFPITDNEKTTMLRKVMTTKLDTTPLKERGASAMAIEFIKSLLIPYPSQRATKQWCFNHPWLAGLDHGDMSRHVKAAPQIENESIEDDYGIDEGFDEEGRPLTADDVNHATSQLSLDETPHQKGGDDSIQDDFDDDVFVGVQTGSDGVYGKGKAVGQTQHHPRPTARHEADEWSINAAVADDSGEPVLPANPPAPIRPNQLFGEIPPSMLQSSGVFPGGANAHHLEDSHMADTTNGTTEYSGPSLDSFSFGGFSNLNNGAATTIVNTPQPLTSSQTADNEADRSSPQLPHMPQHSSEPHAAASLLGTESLVRQLAVISSPRSPREVATPPVEPPKTPVKPSLLGTNNRSVSASKRERPSDENSDGRSMKRPRNHDRQIHGYPPDELYWEHGKPETRETSYVEARRQADPAYSRFVNERREVYEDALEKGEVSQDISFDSWLECIVAEIRTRHEKGRQAGESGGLPNDRTPSSGAALGWMITTSDSFWQSSFPLLAGSTSFGRSPECSVVFPDASDVRVPAHAFKVSFVPGPAGSDLASGSPVSQVEAAPLPLVPRVETGTRKFIRVNNVKLQKGQWGYLAAGDRIAVCYNPEGQQGVLNMDVRLAEGKEVEGRKGDFVVFGEVAR